MVSLLPSFAGILFFGKPISEAEIRAIYVEAEATVVSLVTLLLKRLNNLESEVNELKDRLRRKLSLTIAVSFHLSHRIQALVETALVALVIQAPFCQHHR